MDIKKLVKELENAPKLTSGKKRVSSKYIAEIRRTLELISKMFGLFQPEVKEERIIKIEIPKEIVEAEYKRIREREEGISKGENNVCRTD